MDSENFNFTSVRFVCHEIAQHFRMLFFFYIEDLSSFPYFRASPPLVRAYRVRVRWLATDTSNKISISLKPANIALRRPENRRWAWRWLPKFGPNQQI